MMAGRRVRDRLVPMPLPRFVRVLLAGAAILLCCHPRSGPDARTGTAPSHATPPGAADTARPGRVRVSRVEFTGVSPSILAELRAALSTAPVVALAVGTQGLLLPRPPRRRPPPHRGLLRRARLRRRPRRHLRRRDALADRGGDHLSRRRGAAGPHRRVQTFGLEVLPEEVRQRVMPGELGLAPGAVRTRAAVDRAPRAGPHRAAGRGLSRTPRVAILEAEGRRRPGRRR